MTPAQIAADLTVYQREKLLSIGPDGAIVVRWAWESVQKLRKLGVMESVPVEPTPDHKEACREYLTHLGRKVCANLRGEADFA